MAVVIPFQDIQRARRRQREHEATEQCIQIIELNLRLALEMFGTASADERPLHARRIRQLSALLEYAVHIS